MRHSPDSIDRFCTWESLHDFWFGKVLTNSHTLKTQLKLWFFRDPKSDQDLAERFGSFVDRARFGEFDSWTTTPRSALCLIILLDQVPRNIYRGSPDAYQFDELSLALAKQFLTQGFDRNLHSLERVFMYLPFQHSEKVEDQEVSMKLFNELSAQASPELKEFFMICREQARRHLEAIERFGRFPHRNTILNRISTAQELKFLEDPKSWF